jgi:phage I-like protein
MKQFFHILIEAKAGDAGKAPEWFLLFKAGTINLAGGGPVLVDQKTYDQVAAYLKQRGNDVVIDYEHQTLSGDKAPAAGWIPEIRWNPERGIEARCKWTDEAAAYIEKGEYRYFSPVFLVNKTDRRVVTLHSVALTNAPKTNHLNPILAKLGMENERTIEMKFLEQLIAKLGLAADATEEMVIEAIAKMQAKPPETKEVEVIAKDVLAALDLTEGDTSTVVASIHALKQKDKGMVPREEFDRLQEKIAGQEAERVVAKAMAAGKITPDQKDWATEYAKRDKAGFETFVAKAPVVIPTNKLPEGDNLPDDAHTDPAVLNVAKMMGVEEADLKTYGK